MIHQWAFQKHWQFHMRSLVVRMTVWRVCMNSSVDDKTVSLVSRRSQDCMIVVWMHKLAHDFQFACGAPSMEDPYMKIFCCMKVFRCMTIFCCMTVFHCMKVFRCMAFFCCMKVFHYMKLCRCSQILPCKKVFHCGRAGDNLSSFVECKMKQYFWTCKIVFLVKNKLVSHSFALVFCRSSFHKW